MGDKAFQNGPSRSNLSSESTDIYFTAGDDDENTVSLRKDQEDGRTQSSPRISLGDDLPLGHSGRRVMWVG